MNISVVVLLSVAALYAQEPPAYSVRTVAGGIAIPFPASDVTVDNLRLLEPQHAAVDAAGNIYVSEVYYHRILKLAPGGAVTSIAGGDRAGFSGDGGPASEALLNAPEALLFGPGGDLFFCDSQNRRVRKIDVEGVITTVAGSGAAGASGDNGPALAAAIGTPWGLAVDAGGNLYFSDLANHVIRKIDTAGMITTVAGSVRGFAGDGGPAAEARLTDPRGITVDAAGNLYIADSGNHRVRRVSGGVIRTFAGNGNSGFVGDNGPATSATLFFPSDVRVGVSGNVFIADRSNGSLRRVLSSGVIQTIRTTVRWTLPLGLAFDGQNGLLLVDDLRRQIVRVDLATLAGSEIVSGVRESAQGDGGPALEAGFLDPTGITLDAEGNVYVSDGRDSRVRKITPDGTITTFAGNGVPDQSGDGGLPVLGAVGSPRAIAFDASGNLLVTTAIGGAFVRSVSPDGLLSTIAGTAAFGFAGDGGPAASATFFGLSDVAVDASGNVYLSDSQTHRVRRIGTDGVVTSVAGSGVAGFAGDGGPATAARLSAPSGVAIDPQGRVVIADTGNNRIRRVEPDGNIVTIAGTGVVGAAGDGGPAVEAQVATPRAIRYDADGNLLIPLPARIRRISADGKIYTIAGVVDGTAVPIGVALGTAVANAVSIVPAADGSIYFVENGTRRVRKLEVMGQ